MLLVEALGKGLSLPEVLKWLDAVAVVIMLAILIGTLIRWKRR